MARGIWNGSISFGLVNVPVTLLSAVRDQDIHFTQLHEKDGAPIDTRRFCSKEDKEVPYEEIVAGYEVKKGKWVMLTDEDFEAVEPRKTRTIDIEAFVPVEDVDPIYFDHPYFLVPTGGEGPARAYRLLVRVMKQTDRLALGRFVLRTKEYLAAIRVRGDALSLTTMLFHDEVRDSKGIDSASGKKHAPSKKAVNNAVALIEELTTEFKPSRYKDRHRKRLQQVIQKKSKGQTIEAPKPREEPDGVPDLMAALEESLAKVRG
jgi:DNA end-binding protein Ku